MKDPEAYKRRIRNLIQVKKLSPEEAEDYVQSIVENRTKSLDYEKRIKSKLEEFEKDYDLSSLKANDMMILRAMIQSLINLEDYEQVAYRLQQKISKGEDTQEDLIKLEKLNKLMESLRTSISRFQEDLKISRKIRQSEEESSLSEYLSKLKSKANRFYEQKHIRIFCPDCKTLIFSGWFLYPESPKNKIKLFCKRCGKDYSFSIKEIYNSGMKNYSDVPEF